MPAGGQRVDQRVVVAMRQIVQVLHADDRRDAAALLDLRRRDVAEPDMTHQPLPLKIGQHGQRRFAIEPSDGP